MTIWDLDSIKISLSDNAIHLTVSEDTTSRNIDGKPIIGVCTRACYLLSIFDKLSQDRLCKKIEKCKQKFRKSLERENLLARQSKLLNGDYDI